MVAQKQQTQLRATIHIQKPLTIIG